MPDPGKGDWGRLPPGPSISSVVCWAGRSKQLCPFRDLAPVPRDELLSLACVHCPLKFLLLGVPGLSGVTAQKHPVALEAP